MARKHLRTAGLILAAVAAAANICNASCGSMSCPIDTRSAEQSERGSVRVDYSYEYVNQDQPQIGRQNAAVGEIRGHHDEVYTVSHTQRLAVETGVSDRLSLQASVPYISREHQHIHHHHGE